jgi:hypothetical protein
MNRVLPVSMIASTAIATCGGWDAAAQAQFTVASSQQTQNVAARTQLVTTAQPQLVTTVQPQLVSTVLPQLLTTAQPQLVTNVQSSQLVTANQPQYVMGSPLFRRQLLPHLSLVHAAPAQASSSLVHVAPALLSSAAVAGAQVYTVSAGQTVSSGNYLVSNSLTVHGPVESVSQFEAQHLTRFVDASGSSLGGLLKGLLRQFLQLNGGNSDQNSLLNIGKLILNAVLPFLTNTGGFDWNLAINDLQKIINSLLNEKQAPTPQPGVPSGRVELAPGSYAVSFTDKAGNKTEGTITIGAGGVQPQPVIPIPTNNSNASDAVDRGTRAPVPKFNQ